MPPKRRFGKRLVRSLLPIVLVIALAILASLAFTVYCVSRPTKRAYLVTPQSFSQISGPALKVTDETWANHDGTRARGSVSYTHLRAHETPEHLVCRLLLEKKKQ